jgi:hypothetical protein
MGYIVYGLTAGATARNWAEDGGEMLSMNAYFMSGICSYFDGKSLDNHRWLLYL